MQRTENLNTNRTLPSLRRIALSSLLLGLLLMGAIDAQAAVATPSVKTMTVSTARQGSRAPTKPLATRVLDAEKVFVGVLINRKLLEGDWCHADLKVTKAIKGVKVGELVPVLWRPKIARYDAKKDQKGLAVLKYSHQKRYWLRSDTFEDAKLAEQAVKILGGKKL